MDFEQNFTTKVQFVVIWNIKKKIPPFPSEGNIIIEDVRYIIEFGEFYRFYRKRYFHFYIIIHASLNEYISNIFILKWNIFRTN